ncbi:hypothetical protein HDE_08877 [Halotydeus destructor]|nr:hypothetical protein HDE_08877 [Halotydeus destructor]
MFASLKQVIVLLTLFQCCHFTRGRYSRPDETEADFPSDSDKEQLAIHGIKLVYQGLGYAYDNAWTQVIRVEFPFKYSELENITNDIRADCKMFPVLSYLPTSRLLKNPFTQVYSNTSQHLYDTLRETCQINAKQIRDMTTERLQEMVLQKGSAIMQRRRKRGYPAVILGIISLIAGAVSMVGTGMNSFQIAKVAKTISKLEDEVDKQRLGTLGVAEELVGYTKSSNEHFKKLATGLKKAGAQNMLTRAHMNRLGENVMSQTTRLDSIGATMVLHQFEMMQLSHYSSDILQSANDVLNNWRTGIIKLGNYQLPIELIPRHKLTQILESIDGSLSTTEYRRTYRWSGEYYHRRFANHEFIDDELYVRLTIPLSVKDKELDRLKMFVPEFYPVPFVSHARPTVEKSLGILLEPTKIWVYNQRTLEVTTTDKQNWIWTEGGDFKQADTFQHHPLQEPSACLRQIIRDEPITDCKRVGSSLRYYLPIQMSAQHYMVHNVPNLTVSLICQDVAGVRRVPKASEEAQIVKLRNGCTLNSTHFELIPFRQYSNDTFDIKEGFNMSRSSDLISVESFDNGTRTNSSSFNWTLSEEGMEIEELVLDGVELTRAQSRLKAIIANMSVRLAKLDVEAEKPYKWNTFFIVELLRRTIELYIMLTLLIACVRSGHFIYFFAPHVLVRRAYALEFSDLTSFLPDFGSSSVGELLGFSSFENYLSLVELGLFVLIMCAVIYYQKFLKVYQSTHRGVTGEQKHRFSITLNFQVVSHTLSCQYAQNCWVSIPLSEELPEATVRMEVIRPMIQWRTCMLDRMFALENPVCIRGVDMTGRWTIQITKDIRIPFSSFKWETGPDLIGFRRNRSGIAYVACTGDPTPLALIQFS